MKLVKIEDCYVNTDHIDLVRKAEDGFGTNIFMSGSNIPWEVDLPIKKVLNAICGSEEYVSINAKDIYLKNNGLK
ncbi:hypothetical protein [Pediococcus pentosaceus]|uniref:hypothetical protein n=1 Tax=Pediococcus pentosaceus TaxID=1255 RepID=UPI003981F7CE